AAEGNVDHRALPRHPRGERLDLLERHARMVANPALGRATDDGMLDAVSSEDANRPVVHLHRERDDRDATRPLDELLDAGGQVEAGSGFLELPLGVRERIQLFLRVDPFGTHSVLHWVSRLGLSPWGVM